MKIVVDRTSFIKTLGIVMIAKGTGNQNEWTKGVKFDANKEQIGENKIRMSASDTSINISVDMDATVDMDGSAMIDGDCIKELVEKFVDATLEISFSADKAEIKCGKDSGEYGVMRSDDFVDVLMDASDSAWFSLPVEVISIADGKIRFAAAQLANARPKMGSVNFLVENKKMEIVACDGMKLAKYATTTDTPDISMLLPASLLDRIYRAIKDKGVTTTIQINIKQDKVYLTSDGLKISAVLVDSKYINYNKIIPTTFNLTICFDRKELMRKIAIASIANKFSSDTSKSTYIGVQMADEGFGQGYCTIVNAKNIINKQIGEIQFTHESGEIPKGLCIWVDPNNFNECLKYVDGDIVSINIVNDVTPFMLKAKGASNDSYFTLVMPKSAKKSEG